METYLSSSHFIFVVLVINLYRLQVTNTVLRGSKGSPSPLDARGEEEEEGGSVTVA